MSDRVLQIKRTSLEYLLYIMLVFTVFYAPLSMILYKTWWVRWLGCGTFLVPVTALLLNRYGFFHAAAWFAILLPCVLVVANVIGTGFAHAAVFLFWPTVIAAVALHLRDALLVSGLEMGALVAMSAFSDRFTFFPRGWDILRPDYFSNSAVFIAVTTLAVTLTYRYIRWLYAEVEEARENLEQKVQERTAQLRSSMEQLVQAQKMETVGRLAAGLAHDLNNMLMSVAGYVSVAASILEKKDGRLHGYMKEAEKGLRMADELLRKLVQLSRKQKLTFEEKEINAVVRNVLSVSGKMFPPAVEVRTELYEGTLHVFCDETAVSQVLMNIIVNAKDAMDGEGLLKVASRPVDVDVMGKEGLKPGKYAVVEISDTGPGISRDQLQHVFEPFFTTKRGGTGLGLSVAYSIVRRHGGNITVDSEPGKGSTFSVYLPRYDTEEEKESLRRRLEEGEKEGEWVGTGR